MPIRESGNRSLPERVVKEAVDAGMESPMRETIVEAVDEAEGSRRRMRDVSLVGLAVGTGVTVGYLLGAKGPESAPIERGALSGEAEEMTETVEEVREATTEAAREDESGSRTGVGRLPKLALLAIVGAGLALARRRLRSDEEGWEPIEEVETGIEEGPGPGPEAEGATDDEDDVDAEAAEPDADESEIEEE